MSASRPWTVSCKFKTSGNLYTMEFHYKDAALSFARELFKTGTFSGVDVGRHTFRGWQQALAKGEPLEF